VQYGVSIERQLGEKATGVVSVYSAARHRQLPLSGCERAPRLNGYTVGATLP